jgi:hypothetical protein
MARPVWKIDANSEPASRIRRRIRDQPVLTVWNYWTPGVPFPAGLGIVDLLKLKGYEARRGVGGGRLVPNAIDSTRIADGAVTKADIASGAVGADELSTVHEHFGPVTNITDATAHDGSYATSQSTVSCGVGEDVLSVSPWIGATAADTTSGPLAA